jgi:hypothetical protein
MSHFFADPTLAFLEPKVTQHGSNMVMSQVVKPTKQKLINVDTRFSDDYIYPKHNFNGIESYVLTLPEKINDVKSVRVRSVEIPMSFYNVSAALGNSYFQYFKNGSTTGSMVIVPDGQYNSVSDLTTAIHTANSAFSATSTNQYLTMARTDANSYMLDFNTDICGNLDKYHLRSKMGWLLGFRDTTTLVAGSAAKAPSMVNMHTVRYLFLVVDEFNNSFPNSFLSPMNQYVMNKKILARICVDPAIYPFGTVLHGNEYNGFVVSDKRTYSGKIDIQRMNVQLVTEWGAPVNLNGMDFSFCLEIECE